MCVVTDLVQYSKGIISDSQRRIPDFRSPFAPFYFDSDPIAYLTQAKVQLSIIGVTSSLSVQPERGFNVDCWVHGTLGLKGPSWFLSFSLKHALSKGNDK